MSRGRPTGGSAPKMTKYKGRYARVRIDGKEHALGIWGSPEARRKYDELINDWLRRRSTVPAQAGNDSTRGQSPTTEPGIDSAALTMSHLIVAYCEYRQRFYRRPDGSQSSEWKICQRVMRRLRATYGDLTPVEFGPKLFCQFRESLIHDNRKTEGKPLARSTVTHYCKHVILMFDYAAIERELVDPALAYRLRKVGPLLRGRTDARETSRIPPVAQSVIDATLDQLTPVVADMVRLQLATGMRPNEVCRMRPGEIDRSGYPWVYRPPMHKNDWREDKRLNVLEIEILKPAQAILRPYLLRDAATHCFQPEESYHQDLARRRERRKTPPNQGNGPGKTKPKKFRPSFTTDAYRRAIKRAAERAGVASWSPNQIRKRVLTDATAFAGIECGRQVGNHSDSSTTAKHYAEPDRRISRQFLEQYG